VDAEEQRGRGQGAVRLIEDEYGERDLAEPVAELVDQVRGREPREGEEPEGAQRGGNQRTPKVALSGRRRRRLGLLATLYPFFSFLWVFCISVQFVVGFSRPQCPPEKEARTWVTARVKHQSFK
jgi:hypothetical protein